MELAFDVVEGAGRSVAQFLSGMPYKYMNSGQRLCSVDDSVVVCASEAM